MGNPFGGGAQNRRATHRATGSGTRRDHGALRNPRHRKPAARRGRHPAAERQNLPEGIQLLLRAADILLEAGLLAPVTRIKLRDLPHGHVFYAEKTNGERVLFSERFGSLLDELNNEIDENQFELVIISARGAGLWGGLRR